MPVFMNPFQKHDISDFTDVYVPLGQATRHASVVAAHDEKLGTVGGKVDKGLEAGAYPAGGNDRSAYTIEGLRTEIDLDVAASGHDAAYDRM